jgi:hypothetical protein
MSFRYVDCSRHFAVDIKLDLSADRKLKVQKLEQKPRNTPNNGKAKERELSCPFLIRYTSIVFLPMTWMSEQSEGKNRSSVCDTRAIRLMSGFGKPVSTVLR